MAKVFAASLSSRPKRRGHLDSLRGARVANLTGLFKRAKRVCVCDLRPLAANKASSIRRALTFAYFMLCHQISCCFRRRSTTTRTDRLAAPTTGAFHRAIGPINHRSFKTCAFRAVARAALKPIRELFYALLNSGARLLSVWKILNLMRPFNVRKINTVAPR